MIKELAEKKRHTLDDLLHIMEILRSPGGCPWDREQTHHSIRKNFIEETYEVIEAIDDENPELLQEELGDVLLQVVFHTQMEKEKNVFDFHDVTDGICKKLIERHPHIFGNVIADTADQVLQNWDTIKKRTKGQTNQTETMVSVPRVLPALMRSTKVQQKAAKVGFDWPDVTGALQKIEEELAELKAAIAAGDYDSTQMELGDLLFSVVNVSRFIKADAEEALTRSCNKFIERFAVVERLAQERSLPMISLSIEDLDKLWDEAKQLLEAGN